MPGIQSLTRMTEVLSATIRAIRGKTFSESPYPTLLLYRPFLLM